MSKRKVNRIEIGGSAGPEGSLTHNPFAALKGSAESASPSAKGASTSPQGETPPADAPTLAGSGAIVIRHERKGHGGKTVTVADLSRIDPQARPNLKDLAKQAAKKLGTGARVIGDSLVVQGDVVDRLDRFLTESYGAKTVRGTRP